MNSVGDHNAGAGACGGHTNTAPAQFEDDTVQLTHAGWKRVTDGMARSIVRLQNELDEANARVAMLEEERSILLRERDELRQKNKTLAQCWRDAEQERDEFRMRLESSK